MDTLTYFASQSPMTDLGKYGEQFAAVPADVTAICGVVQGLFLKQEERYKYPIVNERLLGTHARQASAVLDWVMKFKKGGNVVDIREIPDRFLASSSDYANLFVAICREKGIAARKRVGFCNGTSCDYAEYWDGSAWKQIDPSGEIEGEIVSAAAVWTACRAGEQCPCQFVADAQTKQLGWDAVRNNLILDLAAMNKVELLNWDRFGWMQRPFDDFSKKALATMDTAAAALLKADEDFDAVLAVYENEEGLQVPAVVTCDSPLVPPHKAEI